MDLGGWLRSLGLEQYEAAFPRGRPQVIIQEEYGNVSSSIATLVERSIAIRPRLHFSALTGLAVFLLLPGSLSLSLRGALAWDLTAAIYLTLAFRVMLTSTSDAIRVRAARQEEARVVILVIILLAILAGFVNASDGFEERIRILGIDRLQRFVRCILKLPGTADKTRMIIIH